MIRITLRLPEDVHARVVAQAETDRRSLNSEIVHLIEGGLESATRVREERPEG